MFQKQICKLSDIWSKEQILNECENIFWSNILFTKYLFFFTILLSLPLLKINLLFLTPKCLISLNQHYIPLKKNWLHFRKVSKISKHKKRGGVSKICVSNFCWKNSGNFQYVWTINLWVCIEWIYLCAVKKWSMW